MSLPQAQEVDRFIGRFRVLRILGRGSEGVVYLATDPELGRDVAIKTTSLGESPDPTLANLLLSTAQTASKLSHPNIVPVFETGLHEGSPYVVFEFVDGRTLGQTLRANGPLPMAHAVVMMSQILAGVAQIHARSLVHGDIKPANILIGENDRARVADFGLLRHARATDIDHTSGTPCYMAPECFEGIATDCRRDVFALGLIFYEMLTGQPVIEYGTDIAKIMRLLDEIPAPPSAKNPRIPRELDAIVLKALRKDPARRFANAGEMKSELDRIRVSDKTHEQIEVSEVVVHATVEFLLRRMAHKSDFPALSASVTSINQMSAEADTASIRTLSDTVMRDFALTQKLLRLVNSAAVGGRNITKVSAAITILGVGQLRTMATAMMLAGAGGKPSPAIAATLTDAFVAGLISRNVGRINGLAAVEELFICGMFGPLGELLTIYYLTEEYAEIARRVFKSDVKDDSAARAVLGISFEELGVAVARHWQFPPVIVKALSPLPPGELQPSSDPGDRLWQCAAYARELGVLARLYDAGEREAALAAHIQRFAPAIPIEEATVRELMKRSVAAAANYASAAGFAVAKTAMLQGMSELCRPRGDAPPAEPAQLQGSATAPPTTSDTTLDLRHAQPSGFGSRISQALKTLF